VKEDGDVVAKDSMHDTMDQEVMVEFGGLGHRTAEAMVRAAVQARKLE
jgi:hypothetical protein